MLWEGGAEQAAVAIKEGTRGDGALDMPVSLEGLPGQVHSARKQHAEPGSVLFGAAEEGRNQRDSATTPGAVSIPPAQHMGEKPEGVMGQLPGRSAAPRRATPSI